MAKKVKPVPVEWEYDVTQPMLPPDATSPVMDHRQMADWLNRQAEDGWEFAGYGQKRWHNGEMVQDWWIFRRRKA